jgi:hypothetical protein
MPFGIPSEDFHGGFGLPHDDNEPVTEEDIKEKENN